MIRINVLKEDLISRNRKYPVLLLEGGIQEELQKSREDLRKVEKNKNDKLESREKKRDMNTKGNKVTVLHWELMVKLVLTLKKGGQPFQ